MKSSQVTPNVQPISVIIPFRNEGDRILRTVESIVCGRSCSFPLEIVCVDDASNDGAGEQISQLVEGSPEVSLILRRLNCWSGIPFARNRGADAATSPIFFVTDGNVRFPPDWDVPIWKHFRRGRILAATILDEASPFRGYGCQLTLPSMSATWIPVPSAYGGHVPVTACTGTVIDRALFHHLGGYDETLPLYGAAEPEFSVRAWLSGYEIINVPDLRLTHRFRPRAEHQSYLASHGATFRRNYLRFACCYLPDEMLLQTYQHYFDLAPLDFTPCLTELEASGVWQQREQLRRALPLDFRWFARKFLIHSSPAVQ